MKGTLFRELLSQATNLLALAGDKTDIDALTAKKTELLVAAATKKGTATVASGQTTVDVTHSYGSTPNIAQIRVTATNNLGSAAKYWISDVSATTFRINVNVDPGAGTATFVWQII